MQYFAWNNTSEQLTVNAMVAIPAKTEISINYYPREYLRPAQERKRLLNQAYHFTCTCPACDYRPQVSTRRSEERRRERRELNEKDRGQQGPRPRRVQRNQLLGDIQGLCRPSWNSKGPLLSAARRGVRQRKSRGTAERWSSPGGRAEKGQV